MISLRPYQEKGVREIRAAFTSGSRAPCFVSPTGSGKTVTFSYIADQSQAREKRVTIMVHRAELIRQICLALLARDVTYGLIQSGKTMQPDKLTQVASVQTLVQRLDVVAKPDLLIIDECAHATAGSYSKILAAWEGVKTLGVTACPARLDGRGLGDVFDHLVMGPTVRELIDSGFLARPIYYCLPSGVKVDGLHTVAGDYDRHEAEILMDTPKITGSAVEHYTRICPGKPAIAFCTSIKHAEHVTATFQAAGYRSELIEGKMTEQERIGKVKRLSNGGIQVLTSVDLISEGFDVPIVTSAILLRPTQSLSLHLQQLGRPLRPAPGKKNAIILDHVGNCLRHGLAEDPREWTLDETPDRKKKATKSTVAIRQCPKCYAVFAPAPICPQCGHVLPVASRMVDEVSGELIEISGEEMARRQAALKDRESKERAHLENIAKSRGYNPRWATHILEGAQSETGNTRSRVTEHDLQNLIRIELGTRPDVRLFRNNIAGAWTGEFICRRKNGDVILANARPLKAGLFVGSSDLIGWKETRGDTWEHLSTAQFVSLEIKTPRGVVTPDQQNWIDVVNAAGGVAGVVRSVEDAVRLLT